MSRWRLVVVAGLLLVPVVVWATFGSYYLWMKGWAFYVWWPLTACMAAGYLLAWNWQRKQRLLKPPGFEVPVHWADRDAQAWKLVEARASAASSLPADQLGDAEHYLKTAREMANELAAFYHPGATDPVGNLTVPEILAVIELASHDLAEMVEKHLPGGHLLTVNDWKRARQISEWYQAASNLYWAISAVFNPIQTGARYAASRLGISEPLKLLQQNLILWFHTAYVHRLGRYLIDLNAGRLRVGATRFRELVREEKLPAPAGAGAAEQAPEAPREVSIAFVGQVKAGKSSLINALLGEQQAKADVNPVPGGVERYVLEAPGLPAALILLDTPGYGHAGPRADQLAATQEAARQADLIVLALHATNPAREADVALLEHLTAWFGTHPDLKLPPVLAVVTHVDLLSPRMEWLPPYNWTSPNRPKEVSIREALAAAREPFGERLVGLVPVCAAPGKTWNMQDGLLPALTQWLDEARGVALLRCLKAEADRERIVKVFRQLWATGQEAGKQAWESLRTLAQKA
jgi:predicted GTPase